MRRRPRRSVRAHVVTTIIKCQMHFLKHRPYDVTLYRVLVHHPDDGIGLDKPGASQYEAPGQLHCESIQRLSGRLWASRKQRLNVGCKQVSGGDRTKSFVDVHIAT